jgi:hypothetical protein
MRLRRHIGARAAAATARRRIEAALLALAVLAALAVVQAGCGGGSDEDVIAGESSRGPGVNELLKKELELASGKEFYFVLDPASSKLKMTLSGVTLHEYEVLEVAVGTPRLFFKRRRPPEGWLDRAWHGGGLAPARDRDRVEVVSAEADSGDDPSEEAEPVVPPTAEEAVDVPSPYRIRFDGGFALEIRARGAGGEEIESGGPSAWLWSAASEIAGSLGLPVRDRMRLVLYLSEEDAAALYRSAPPNVSFLAVTHQ